MDKQQPKLQKITSLTTVKPSLGVFTLKNNSSFCNMILKQNKMMPSVVSEPSLFGEERQDLVYNVSSSYGYETSSYICFAGRSDLTISFMKLGFFTRTGPIICVPYTFLK